MLKTVQCAFLKIEGENYIDSIFNILIRCMNENDKICFSKVIQIFFEIGESSTRKSINIQFLISKILENPNKIDYLHEIFKGIQI